MIRMSAVKITDRISAVPVLNPAMRIFDVVMKTDYGTSYNSYIVKGDSKSALIETAHATFFSQYVETIKSVCDPGEIEYIVLNHCEPDHSGALKELLDLCPNAKIYVSRAGSIYLKGITNRDDLPVIIAKDGDSIDLGGATLRFISAPFLHWPDSMFTYCEEEKTVFTCDLLGSHYCEPYILDTLVAYPEKYFDALRGYFDAIFGPFKSYVRAGLKKLSELDYNNACTSHGPVLTRDGKLDKVLSLYTQWSAELPSAEDIPVFYCSAYGNTEKLAQAISKGILRAKPNAVSEAVDINSCDMPSLQARLNACSAFAIGSPTINSDAVAPVWELLSHVDAINSKKRPALVFGSYGWSGEAVPNIIARLNGLRMSVFEDGMKVTFVPSDEDIKNAEELGFRFASSF